MLRVCFSWKICHFLRHLLADHVISLCSSILASSSSPTIYTARSSIFKHEVKSLVCSLTYGLFIVNFCVITFGFNSNFVSKNILLLQFVSDCSQRSIEEHYSSFSLWEYLNVKMKILNEILYKKNTSKLHCRKAAKIETSE